MPIEADTNRYRRDLNPVLGFETSCKHFIIDPLHGPIPMTTVESKVLQTSLFQRLRNIKQLGFASSLYPGANHSRFEHSVGTLFTTWELFKRFMINSTSHDRWLGKFKISSFNAQSTLQALRLAGLVHDIGHGPYSHTFDMILDDYLEKAMNHESLTLYMLSHGLDEKIKPSSNNAIAGVKEIAAERLTWKMIQKHREEMAGAINDRRLQRQILMILNKDLEFRDSKPSKRFAQIRFFLNELITGDIGSDRIDYLLRDTYFTGLGHRFSLSQIFESIVGIFDTKKGFLRFAINSESRNAIEFLLTTRYYHYRLIAHNPRNMDQQVRFKSRIKEKTRRKPLEMMKLATLDEYTVQRYLLPSSKPFVRVLTSDLRDIKLNLSRFFFYRVADDRTLRKKYISAIRRNVLKLVKNRNPHSRLKYDDILVEIILEKPHIPLLHVYRDKYEIEKSKSIEYHSILFHDWSDIVTALARTYVLDSLLMIYAPRRFKEEITKALSSSRDFYLSKILFKKLFRRNLARKSIHRLDVMLSALYRATDSGLKPIIRILDFFKKVNEIQRNLGVSRYLLESCYSAEDQVTFDYCQSALNDLFIFAISEAIGIEIKYMPSKAVKGKRTWKQKYIITPMASHTQNGQRTPILEQLLSYYPKRFKELLTM